MCYSGRRENYCLVVGMAFSFLSVRLFVRLRHERRFYLPSWQCLL